MKEKAVYKGAMAVKRWLALAVAAVLALMTGALAEGLGSLAAYLKDADVSALGAKAWTEEAGGRILSVSPSADALVSLCAEGDVLVAISVTAPQGDDCEAYARVALPACGMIDARTLDALMEKGGESGGVRLIRLTGEAREGAYLCLSEDVSRLFWQPLHGGKKRHRSPDCSGMDVPRLVTAEAADALGFDPCKKCAK